MTKEECIAILRRYADYDGMGIQNLTGCKEAMKMAADLLSAEHPSLPSDIDEAAEEYGKRQGSELRPFGTKFFKAGAEWMAGQGVKATATVGYYNQSGLSILTEPSIKKLGFKEGDELEITIRKK